mgnify:CR=1 FL=1
MRKSMGAALATAFGRPLVLGDVEMPVPRAGQVLVKVAACGVCHTDIHAVDGDWPVKPKATAKRFGACILRQVGFDCHEPPD